jgi:type IV pilus assembly protein PilC
MFTPGQLNRRAQLYDQLGSMIVAGVPLTQALEMASRNASLGSSRKLIRALIVHLQEGFTFADSMKKVSGWLPEFDVALLSAGEESGRLDSTFKLLARHYTMRAQIIRNTISQMLQTIVTLHVFFLLFPLTLLINLIMGNDAQFYAFILEKIIVFGSIYGSAFLIIFACGGKRNETWRTIVEDFFMLVPLLRPTLKYLAIARLTASLGALTNAGVSVIRSWELSASACGSPRLKREILRWTPLLETGTTPADMVNQISYFPEMFANLFQTAEVSGKMDETLVRLEKYYEDEGFRMLQWFTRVVNGIVYGLVVLLVAKTVIGFYTGYFNSVNAI